MDPLLSHLLDPLRIIEHRSGPPRLGGRYVLYWCQMQRRAEWSAALAYAVARADELHLPVVVYEGLRPDYPHASWRHHRFILDGAVELGQRLRAQGMAHLFYLQKAGERRPLVRELAAQAALVVTDDFPAFIIPRQTARAAAQLDCPLHAVDGIGAAPLRRFDKREIGARTLRPKLWRLLPDLLAHLLHHDAPPPVPQRDSLALPLPSFPPLPESAEELDALVRGCGVDLQVRPAPGVRGGRAAGLVRLQRFLREGLPRYAAERNRADVDVTSHLSPYLHHGMLSPLEIVAAVLRARPAGVADDNVAAYLEELLVRRELAFNFCHHTPDPAGLTTTAALPAWAQESLRRHEADARAQLYDLATLEAGRSGDRLWNGVQHELRERGEPHGYLRMLWGKQIITWTRSGDEALRFMAHLNDKFAYDGRDANSYTSFLWCLGLHDRPFPRRPVFGVLRPMTSESTGRKAGGGGYLRRIGWLPVDAGAARP